jgi:hypothetical protein
MLKRAQVIDIRLPWLVGENGEEGGGRMEIGGGGGKSQAKVRLVRLSRRSRSPTCRKSNVCSCMLRAVTASTHTQGFWVTAVNVTFCAFSCNWKCTVLVLLAQK